MNSIESLKSEIEAKLESCARMAEELTQQRDNWKFLQEETSKSRAEWQARAEKAEAQLSECLAATNEVLQEALATGRAEEDVPEKVLVKAVRAAARLGAEEMRRNAAKQVYAGEVATIRLAILRLPLPGEGT